jgi:phosphoglycerate dehydrogenase-like enzyme
VSTRVVVLDDYQDAARRFGRWDRLSDRIELTVHHDHFGRPEDLVGALKAATVVVAMRERSAFPASVLERLPALELLVTTGMANAVIDVAAAGRQGVTVCGTGGLVRPTAELTWGLILSLARGICVEDGRVRAGRWQSTVGMDLAGRTLGVLGLGRLGSRVARIAQAFRMDVLAWSQNLTVADAEAAGVAYVKKDELFSFSDIVTVHLQLSDRTRGIVGAPELGLMKPSAYLVNTSRGPLVDEDALVDALRSGGIAGAGLDVFDTEPLPTGHPLLTAPNTVLTPHLGYVTEGTYEVFYREIVEDIEAYLDGTPTRVITA